MDDDQVSPPVWRQRRRQRRRLTTAVRGEGGNGRERKKGKREKNSTRLPRPCDYDDDRARNAAPADEAARHGTVGALLRLLGRRSGGRKNDRPRNALPPSPPPSPPAARECGGYAAVSSARDNASVGNGDKPFKNGSGNAFETSRNLIIR